MTLTIETIEPGITRVRLSSWQGRLVGYEVSAYVIRGILVDSGFVRGARELALAIDTLRPRGAIITHWHEDHAGNAPMLSERGLPIRMHAVCEATLRRRPPIGAYRHVIWGQTPRLVTPLGDLDPAPLTLIELPGHSADHLVVWDAEQRVLASGDLFLGVRVRVAHRHESPRRLLASLRAAAALEPRLLLDAHRGPLSDATSRLRAKIAWLDETIGRIVERHAVGDSPRAIARRVLGREAPVGYVSVGEYSKRAFVGAVLLEGQPEH